MVFITRKENPGKGGDRERERDVGSVYVLCALSSQYINRLEDLFPELCARTSKILHF